MENFKQLLDKQDVDGALEFLRGLPQAERRALAPQIRKWDKQYNEYIQEGNTWRNKITPEESHILSYAAFICYTKQEIEKNFPSWIIGEQRTDHVLSWYCPPWFSDVVNGFASQEWLPYRLTYEYALELKKAGYLEPHPHLIARLLVKVIYEMEKGGNRYVPEKLLTHPETLKEHIWYVFEYDTNIHTMDWYIRINGETKKNDSWTAAIIRYTAEGKIDRGRLLTETIYATNKNFNKTLSGWFADLFTGLKATTAELLGLQQEIFTMFSSPHSKIVNTALQSCKDIVADPHFDHAGFLDHVPLLLSSSTKSVTLSTVQLLEKLGRSGSVSGEELARLAVKGLFHKDESLQTRIAKFIVSNGKIDDTELREQLQIYVPSLFSGTRILLGAFIDETPVAFSELPMVTGPVVQVKAIQDITDVEELVFFASQAFDNNQTFHLDLLPASLLRFQSKINGEDISRLEPAFQRALKIFFGDMRSTQGYLDQLLAAFFLDYGQLLMRKFPEHRSSLWKLYDGFLTKTESNKKLWEEHGNRLEFLSGCNSGNTNSLYEPHRIILLYALSMLRKETHLPLLSTPTHEPCWIDPVTLVERFIAYQSAEADASDMDLQVAISRCRLTDAKAAIQLAENNLAEELKNLVKFLLVPDEEPKGPFTQPSAWMIAGLTKSPGKHYPEFGSFDYFKNPVNVYSGQYSWSTIIENYSYDTYKWENEKFVTVPEYNTRKVLRIDLNPKKEIPKKQGLGKLLSKFIGDRNKPEAVEPLIFDHLKIAKEYLIVEDRDIERLLYLTPNHTSPIIALVTDRCLTHPKIPGETEKRMVLGAIRALHSVWAKQDEMGHLFLATCMVSSEKAIAVYAAEIWIEAVRDRTIDSTVIGKILGIHQRIEFVPLKRLTDLMLSNLMGVSKEHNQQLELLITSLLAQLPATPIKNIKKLLEIYLELLNSNNSSVTNEDVLANITEWKKTEGLSKVLSKL